jgi:hypothetical protein
MTPVSDSLRCEQVELISAYVLRILPAREMAVLEQHISACSPCRLEVEALRPLVDSFVFWPTDVLRPSQSLWPRLARRLAAETGEDPLLASASGLEATEPQWEAVAPGISCKLLATDSENHRVSMLVRLAPGADYPPHTHAGIEELHLLHGELWIDDRKLYPGDYNRAEEGTADKRVHSDTGCTCVLITSTRDKVG